MPPAKRPKRRQPEPLFRMIDITSVAAWISVASIRNVARSPQWSSRVTLDVVGRLTEPLRGIGAVEITVHAADPKQASVGKPPSIGFVRALKPTEIASVFILDQEFDGLCSLATGGLLRHARMTLTPPRYNSADVLSVSFSAQLRSDLGEISALKPSRPRNRAAGSRLDK